MNPVIGDRYILDVSEFDIDPQGKSRLTTAGNIIEVTGFDSGLWDVICRETGAWFRFNTEELNDLRRVDDE